MKSENFLFLIWNVPSWNIENCWNFSLTCLSLWDMSFYFCKNGSRTPCNVQKLMKACFLYFQLISCHFSLFWSFALFDSPVLVIHFMTLRLTRGWCYGGEFWVVPLVLTPPIWKLWGSCCNMAMALTITWEKWPFSSLSMSMNVSLYVPHYAQMPNTHCFTKVQNCSNQHCVVAWKQFISRLIDSFSDPIIHSQSKRWLNCRQCRCFKIHEFLWNWKKAI